MYVHLSIYPPHSISSFLPSFLLTIYIHSLNKYTETSIPSIYYVSVTILITGNRADTKTYKFSVLTNIMLGQTEYKQKKKEREFQVVVIVMKKIK